MSINPGKYPQGSCHLSFLHSLTKLGIYILTMFIIRDTLKTIQAPTYRDLVS